MQLCKQSDEAKFARADLFIIFVRHIRKESIINYIFRLYLFTSFSQYKRFFFNKLNENVKKISVRISYGWFQN